MISALEERGNKAIADALQMKAELSLMFGMRSMGKHENLLD